MTANLISSLHIQKLGHDILEIRERALYNLSSKLRNGFKFENELAQTKELLLKLFQWFLYTPCTKEGVVLDLIKDILRSETGKVLISHYGVDSLKKELKQIRTFIEPKFHNALDEIIALLGGSATANVIVPPLECDVPLSYRTGDGNSNFHLDVEVETPATTIEGFVQQLSSRNQKNSPLIDPPSRSSGASSGTNCHDLIDNGFSWQYLIEPDKRVLETVERTLEGPSESDALLHAVEFFTNMLLHDFPAEVFLQRPTIVNALHNLLDNSTSVKLSSSILNSLLSLTRALQVRIHQNNDPCMYNLKNNPHISTYQHIIDTSSNNSSRSSIEIEDETSVVVLRKLEMPLSTYCNLMCTSVFRFLCSKPEGFAFPKLRTQENATLLALLLLEEAQNTTILVFSNDIWDEESTPELRKILKDLNTILVEYGDALEYTRVEAANSDFGLDCRLIQISFLHGCIKLLLKLVPPSEASSILPLNLRNALASVMLDVTLEKLYPDMYNSVVQYAEACSRSFSNDVFLKCRETKKICTSMQNAVQFLRTYKSLSAADGISLAKEAMPSLEYHRDLSFLVQFVELCSRKLHSHFSDESLMRDCEAVVLKLLAHNLNEVEEKMYTLSRVKITEAIGPRLNASGSGTSTAQILFLIRPSIFLEMTLHGLTSENDKIRNCSECIFIHLLKCKILVSDEIWNKIVESLIMPLPALLSYANKNSALGKLLLNIVDPDTAKDFNIPSIEVTKSNILLLFNSDLSVREEAFSRLCWLLTSSSNCRHLLPKISSLHDRSLTSALYQVQPTFDINIDKHTQHIYQPSSLQQVLELLRAPNVEPVIYRSALSQAAVMMEDPLLHTTFLECDGLTVITNIMREALTDNNFQFYPDSVLPIVSILKCLCIYHSSVRQQLSQQMDIYHCVLRSLFLYFTEERMKRDAGCLLFCLIFHNFIQGSPSKADFSVPDLIYKTISVPFKCNTHWKISRHCPQSEFSLLTSDRWCLSSIQTQWNIEIVGGLNELLSFNQQEYQQRADIIDLLKLNTYDFHCLKSSMVMYGIKENVTAVQNGTTHEKIIEYINKLALYLHVYRISKKKESTEFLSLPWENTFSRFLKVLPSSNDDVKLLNSVVQFLKLLVPLCKSEKTFWLTHMFKSPTNCILDLISSHDNSADADFKSLNQELLSLLTLCASQEQRCVHYSGEATAVENDNLSWNVAIQLIGDAVRWNNRTCFYNLSYVTSLLTCLVHLTATLGWSRSKRDSELKSTIMKMITCLCELVIVFHCGKGSTATNSVMGLSITRHAVFALNHLLGEIHFWKLKHWEETFVEMEDESLLKSFLILWSSRDVVLRAAAVQFFAGLSTSPRLAIHLVHELKEKHFWHMVITLLVDHKEASLVRENCARLLSNLIRHFCFDSYGSKLTLISSLNPEATEKNEEAAFSIFNLFQDYEFYKNVGILVNSLYTHHLITSQQQTENSNRKHFKHKREESRGAIIDQALNVTTPSFLTSVGFLLQNLYLLDSSLLCSNLVDFNLVKLLFRCICHPFMEVNDVKGLALYCDILEMNTSICLLLRHVISHNEICLGIILHTKDCLTVLFSLMNVKSYYVDLPQLIFLRNRLLTEIFKVISVLTVYGSDTSRNIQGHFQEAQEIICQTILDTGSHAFLDTVSKAIASTNCNDLQNAALMMMTSLLGIEACECNHKAFSKVSSLRHLLDTTRISSQFSFEKIKECGQKKLRSSGDRAFSIGTNNSTAHRESDGSHIAGVEICKHLLSLYSLIDCKAKERVIQKESLIVSTLTVTLFVSLQAKNYALQNGFVGVIMNQLKDLYVNLSLESVDSLKRTLDKKRIIPRLTQLDERIGLITNFMCKSEDVKHKFVDSGLTHIIHKLWVWFLVQRTYFIDLLKMICTFTTNCDKACHSLLLGSPLGGREIVKSTNNASLMNAMIKWVEKEMEQISKTRDLNSLELCFTIFTNCCSTFECRVLLGKSNLLNSVLKLHPSLTKKQSCWVSVEAMWLNFLHNFSFHVEGQSCITRTEGVVDLLITLSTTSKFENRLCALTVLRNISFYHPSRPKLLNSDSFLFMLQSKIEGGRSEERDAIVMIIWSIAANNQKAKVIFKAAQIDVKLRQMLRQFQLLPETVQSEVCEKNVGHALRVLEAKSDLI